jgi:hypothetical protein
LHASTQVHGLDRVTLQQSVLSWSAVAQSSPSINQLTNVVPGALAVYDLPDLAAALGPTGESGRTFSTRLTIRDVRDAAGNPVTQAVLDNAYADCRKAYQHHQDKLILQAGP